MRLKPPTSDSRLDQGCRSCDRHYIIRRILALFPTLLLIYSLTFFLMHSTPGGPWDTGRKTDPGRCAGTVEGGLRPRQATLAAIHRFSRQGPPRRSWPVVRPALAHRSPTSSARPFRSRCNWPRWRSSSPSLSAFRSGSWARSATTSRSTISPRSSRSSASRPRRTSRPRCWSSSWPASCTWYRPAVGMASAVRRSSFPPLSLALYPMAVLARYTRSSMLEVLAHRLHAHRALQGTRESGQS